ncbi:hypothetical protein SLEP1_g28235 [Rubroshorea leprosula]|uniref:Reverse transcriptase zinc-binding domain-containing protein n=1 Tax=Rubroshorea leprosula TaxID=152421 RepID=A0AAV5K2E2_9ROSI|nr:hypothetical protein SLEP1_g28235 [Rubroshorea leprosula]
MSEEELVAILIDLSGSFGGDNTMMKGKSVVKGSQTSWAWSSILKGRDIVQLGVRWNMGNGQDVLIFQDKWIPGFKVVSPPGTYSLFSHVCELLDDYGEWDITKLNACFSSEECQEILKIPIGAGFDSLVWHLDKYGRFSIKSAYLLAFNTIHEPSMDSNNMPLSPIEWKHLWKLKVPPKVRVFMWRAFLNSLPSLDNLVKSRIVQEVIACISCMIQKYSSPNKMHLLASPSKSWIVGKKNLSSWSKPLQGTLKVNVDASFSQNLGSTTLAMAMGNFGFGKTWFCMALSPLMAKGTALLKAVRFMFVPRDNNWVAD